MQAPGQGHVQGHCEVWKAEPQSGLESEPSPLGEKEEGKRVTLDLGQGMRGG